MRRTLWQTVSIHLQASTVPYTARQCKFTMGLPLTNPDLDEDSLESGLTVKTVKLPRVLLGGIS